MNEFKSMTDYGPVKIWPSQKDQTHSFLENRFWAHMDITVGPISVGDVLEWSDGVRQCDSDFLNFNPRSSHPFY